MSESWEEFRNRCAATVQKIHDTKDDGVYAKLYEENVGRLLRMLDCIDAESEPFGSGADAAVAFERTK